MWRHLFRRKVNQPKGGAQEIDIWRVKALFNNFRKILQFNTLVFEQIAAMDRALGGEYIFDRNFLEDSVRKIASHVHHVTYNLNALTNNGYVPLYDRYQEIRIILDDILAGNTKALSCPPVLPLESLSWELEPLVGIDLICLAELRHHPGMKARDGLVISSDATHAMLQNTTSTALSETGLSFDGVTESLRNSLQSLLAEHHRPLLSISATRLDGLPGEPRDLGEFLLKENGDDGLVVLAENVFPLEQATGNPGANSPSPRETIGRDTQNSSFEDLFLKGIIRIIAIAAERCHTLFPDTEPHFALFLRPAYNALARGTIITRAAGKMATPLLTVTSWLPGNRQEMDIHQLRRIFPFDFVSSTVTAKTMNRLFPDGLQATSDTPEHGHFQRGSATILPWEIQALAETAMILERIMGVPVIMHWEYLENGKFVATRLFPFLEKPVEPTALELEHERENAVVLGEGGQVVQSGVAAGTVFHVTQYTNLNEFPIGGVAVAPIATPQLTPILHRASAILTEHGNPIGHLATVARELSLPALFGIPGILEQLPNGTEVTVDASQGCVYKGVLNHLLQQGTSDNSFSPIDSEYRVLRRLLRFISPLKLVNPDDLNFSAQNCRSFHDIIHFCHEMAVDELAHFQERRPGLSGIRTARLHLPVQMDINLLDIGGGLQDGSVQQPGPADILSEPFAIYLDGLLHPQAAGEELPTLGIRDIISAIPRTSRLSSVSPEMSGNNLAIISQEYMNLSLRLGYHFSVIDAHLASDRHRNYIYFRFIGGLADQTRRARRALFISDVLGAMDFKVFWKGDLVVGRMKFEEKDVLRSALFVLGALTTYSRQRDTSLYSDEMGKELFERFADTFLLPFGKKSATHRSLRTSAESHPAGRLRKSPVSTPTGLPSGDEL
ncbi:MAG: PEP-utilizing enzyme [Pseudomonadota bacterium]